MAKGFQFVDDNSNATPVMKPIGDSVTVDGSSASAQSSAYTEQTVVRVFSSTLFYVKVGPNPTASATDSMPVAANAREEIRVDAGDKIAVYGANVFLTTMG